MDHGVRSRGGEGIENICSPGSGAPATTLVDINTDLTQQAGMDLKTAETRKQKRMASKLPTLRKETTRRRRKTPKEKLLLTNYTREEQDRPKRYYSNGRWKFNLLQELTYTN